MYQALPRGGPGVSRQPSQPSKAITDIVIIQSYHPSMHVLGWHGAMFLLHAVLGWHCMVSPSRQYRRGLIFSRGRCGCFDGKPSESPFESPAVQGAGTAPAGTAPESHPSLHPSHQQFKVWALRRKAIRVSIRVTSSSRCGHCAGKPSESPSESPAVQGAGTAPESHPSLHPSHQQFKVRALRRKAIRVSIRVTSSSRCGHCAGKPSESPGFCPTTTTAGDNIGVRLGDSPDASPHTHLEKKARNHCAVRFSPSSATNT
jgi:hypothetical protein